MPTQALVTVAGKVTASITNTTITNANAEGTTGIIPTVSGTGVSVGALGKVSFTTATAVTVIGCFTAAYDNYRIEFDLVTSAAATITLTLATTGTPAAGANYDTQRFTVINTVAAGVQTLLATAWVASGGIAILGGRHVGWIELYKPALATATGGLIRNGITANPMTTSSGIYDGLLQHELATAYDGFQLAVGSGTITGALRVKGNNNL